MSPDDPRHGTRPGALQHYKDGEKPCGPCAAETYRVEKAAKLRRARGHANLLPLGEEAWRIVSNPLASRRQLSAATGVSTAQIARLARRGPSAIVQRSTRDSILNGGRSLHAITAIGLQRRLQALSAIGWSMKVIADQYGIWADPLCSLRRRANPKAVKLEFARVIVRIYDDLSMKLPPAGISADRTRMLAAQHGYLSPLAWEDETIDDPAAKPVGISDQHAKKEGLDESAIERRMAGDRSAKTRGPENFEVVRRLLADGRSQRWIANRTGLKVERYLPHHHAQEVAA